jgi:hypothetical protein
MDLQAFTGRNGCTKLRGVVSLTGAVDSWCRNIAKRGTIATSHYIVKDKSWYKKSENILISSKSHKMAAKLIPPTLQKKKVTQTLATSTTKPSP